MWNTAGSAPREAIVIAPSHVGKVFLFEEPLIDNQPAPSDFSFINHGSLCILTPVTKAANDWIGLHIPDDAMTWCNGIVIEPRYAEAILDGIACDGLTVNA